MLVVYDWCDVELVCVCDIGVLVLCVCVWLSVLFVRCFVYGVVLCVVCFVMCVWCCVLIGGQLAEWSKAPV